MRVYLGQTTCLLANSYLQRGCQAYSSGSYSRLKIAVPVELAQFFGHILAEEFGSVYEGGEPVAAGEKGGRLG